MGYNNQNSSSDLYDSQSVVATGNLYSNVVISHNDSLYVPHTVMQQPLQGGEGERDGEGGSERS